MQKIKIVFVRTISYCYMKCIVGLYEVHCGALFHPERSDVRSFHAVKFALSHSLYRGSIVKVDKETDPLILGVSGIGSVLLPAVSFL